MRIVNCETHYCRLLQWWEQQPKLLQNLTILVVVLVFWLLLTLITNMFDVGEPEWIWHIAA